jgi:hypothetical protein
VLVEVRGDVREEHRLGLLEHGRHERRRVRPERIGARQRLEQRLELRIDVGARDPLQLIPRRQEDVQRVGQPRHDDFGDAREDGLRVERGGEQLARLRK